MEYRMVSCFALTSLLVGASSSWAHHGFTAVFDPAKKLSVTGTLTRVDYRNPHIQLSLTVKTNRDELESWEIEAGPPAFFARSGISRATFLKAIGQTVTVEAHPARNGSPRGSLLKITFADGTSVVNDPSV